MPEAKWRWAIINGRPVEGWATIHAQQGYEGWTYTYDLIAAGGKSYKGIQTIYETKRHACQEILRALKLNVQQTAAAIEDAVHVNAQANRLLLEFITEHGL